MRGMVGAQRTRLPAGEQKKTIAADVSRRSREQSGSTFGRECAASRRCMSVVPLAEAEPLAPARGVTGPWRPWRRQVMPRPKRFADRRGVAPPLLMHCPTPTGGVHQAAFHILRSMFAASTRENAMYTETP